MPFKDLQRRREYMKQYKKRYRRSEAYAQEKAKLKKMKQLLAKHEESNFIACPNCGIIIPKTQVHPL